MYFIALITLYILRENGVTVPEGIIVASWCMFAGAAIKATFKLVSKLDEESKRV
jgi:hypothetical protein